MKSAIESATARRYDFNLPWPAVIIGVAFYAGLSAFMAFLARDFVGVIFVFLIMLSAIFGILGVIMMTRRSVFPHAIELTDDVILYPHGFPRTRITSIPYVDILRIENRGDGNQTGLTVVSGPGPFAISASYFAQAEDYRAVKDFICTRTSIVIPREEKPEPLKWGDWRIRGFPEPLLRWKEPEEWPRYRTHLAKSKPMLPRIVSALWFFARWFVVFLIPWLLLRLLGVPTAGTTPFLCLVILVALFFTWIFHWLTAIWPVHCTEISFRDNGITQFFGKQTADWNYHHFSGWAMIERQFEGQSILILLLKGRFGITSFAIPDIAIRDQLTRLLHDKSIPHAPDLKPPWEDVG
jgi:hypothetical protein